MKTIEVFETTDVHGYLVDTSSGNESTFQYRMAYIANAVNEARANAENDAVLLLDGGDIYGLRGDAREECIELAPEGSEKCLFRAHAVKSWMWPV